MQLSNFDHVNVKTANLETMVTWYCERLGMTHGWRPDFPFPGAWLYLGEQPFIHLVSADAEETMVEGRIEHYAFAATGYREFITRLEAADETYRVAHVPGTDIVQVNVHDPDGNHIHIDFNQSEID